MDKRHTRRARRASKIERERDREKGKAGLGGERAPRIEDARGAPGLRVREREGGFARARVYPQRVKLYAIPSAPSSLAVCAAACHSDTTSLGHNVEGERERERERKRRRRWRRRSIRCNLYKMAAAALCVTR